MPSFRTATAAVASALLSLAPAAAQVPGAPDLTRVTAGTYAADPRHTQVAWSLNHFGFSTYDGLFGGVTGTLALDPARPAATKVEITIPVDGLVTTVPALTEHLKSSDFFDAAKYPTATFASTGVTFHGSTARIAGMLTLHGVSKPVVLDATFVGAGANPVSKKATVGFAATTHVKRSDFGITAYAPALGDDVELHINAAFEKVG